MNAKAANSAPKAASTTSVASNKILQRQCACGNHTASGGECSTCASKKLQRKLSIGSTNDPMELEADRVADQVMAYQPAHSFSNISTPKIQRRAEHSSEKAGEVPASVEQVLASSGSPLPTAVRKDMEQRFGQDFSQVRMHTGSAAEQSATDVNANAYTVGNNIVFNRGKFSPENQDGKRLLAHELTHVVQQSQSAQQDNVTQASSGTLRRSTNPLAGLSINELRKQAVTNKAAAEELWRRFDAMSNTELERYARNDPMAQSIFSQRKIPAKEGIGQGRFSNPSIEGSLTQDLVTARKNGPVRSANPGAPTEGGTMGVARTDIPGFENRSFIGKSPQAGGALNANSNFPPATDPKELPHTHAHAEQHIADQLEAALKSIPREQLKGRTVWMLIEQEPCSTCAQGTNNANTKAGVLKKLSDAYPELRFEIKNLNTSGRIVIEARPVPPGLIKPTPTTIPKSEPSPSINKAPPELGNKPPSALDIPEPAVQLPKPGMPKVPTVTEGGTPKLPAAILEESVPKVPPGALKSAIPKVPELEVPGVKPGTTGRGIAPLGRGVGARLGAAALEGAVGIVLGVAMLVTDLIIQYIIMPKLLEWQRKLEESRRLYLQKQIQDWFAQYETPGIIRTIRDCYLADLQALEAAGKTGYVNVTMKVRLEDTSNRFQLFEETFPESPFDIEFDSASIDHVTLAEKPVETKAGEITRCDNCGTFGRDKTFVTNNPLWEQSIIFSFIAPSSESLLAEYPLKQGEDVSKQSCCFIATACFGSALAPQVLTLREFRDAWLMEHSAGRQFVHFYYLFSPPIASWLRKHAFARAVTREGLIRPIAALVLWSGKSKRRRIDL